MTRRLLSISHSYAVTANRRLADEMARAGGDAWSVTAVAPETFPGDLGPLQTVAARDERCTLVRVPVRNAAHPHLMWYGRQLRGLLKQPWDIVHCWEEPYIVAGAQIARWTQRDARLVYATFQNIDKRYPPPFGTLERYSMSRAAGWVAFGHTVQQALSRRHAYAGLTHSIIPPGVDMDHFAPDPAMAHDMRESLGWQEPSIPIIGFLGRFVPEKGLSLLMRALDAVQHPWRALIVGGGPLEGALHEWAARRPGRVHIITGVAHHDVPRYLAAMDLLCAPSVTTPSWREQFGRMLIEAFAAGVPVIGSDSGEIPFVIGDAGRVVPEGDEPAWTRAIDELLSDAPRRAMFRERGMTRARTEFAWPVVARRHIDFFQSLLHGSPRAEGAAA